MKKVITIEVAISESNDLLCCLIKGNVNTKETGVKIIGMGDPLHDSTYSPVITSKESSTIC